MTTAEMLQILYWIENLASQTPYYFTRLPVHDRQWDENYLEYRIVRQSDDHPICTLDLYGDYKLKINGVKEFAKEAHEYNTCMSIISAMDKQLTETKEKFKEFITNNAGKYLFEFVEHRYDVSLRVEKGPVETEPVYTITTITNARLNTYAFLNLVVGQQEIIPVLPRNILISHRLFDYARTNGIR